MPTQEADWVTADDEGKCSDSCRRGKKWDETLAVARARSVKVGSKLPARHNMVSLGYENFVELERANFHANWGGLGFCTLRYLETRNDRSRLDGPEMGWTSSGEP